MSDSLVSIGLYLTYFMFGLAAIAAIVFPLLNMFKNPKSAKNTLIGLGAMLAIFGISYSIAGGEILPQFEKYGVTASLSKMVSAGLIVFYSLFIGSIVAVLYSEFSKIFK